MDRRACSKRSIRFCRDVLIGLWAAAATTAPAAVLGEEPAAKTKIDFRAEVAPILRQHCIDCHGPALQMSDLRLDQRGAVLIDGRDRDLIKPGHSADSLLIQRLVDKDLGLIMPPTFPFFPEDKLGLPEAQIRVLKQWIDEGADWPEGVSLANKEPSTSDTPQLKALLAAIRARDRDAVERLLTKHSLVDTVDRHGATPLMYAALYADAPLVRLLIKRGANVNTSDQSGATALMWAAGDPDKVRLLVEAGARVDVRSDMGRTPLLVASTYAGNAEVVRLLLKSGARADDRDQFGETALTSASKRGDVELVETLIAAGADVHHHGGFGGRSPLIWAAEEGNVETIRCLLKHGAARDAKGLNGALFSAAVRGSAEAVRALIESGADVNAAAGFAGYTPLMGAAYSDTVDARIVRMLLAKGADVNAKAATGDTALALARKHGQTKVVELLEQAGAKE